jgi:hypothetical protein
MTFISSSSRPGRRSIHSYRPSLAGPLPGTHTPHIGPKSCHACRSSRLRAFRYRTHPSRTQNDRIKAYCKAALRILTRGVASKFSRGGHIAYDSHAERQIAGDPGWRTPDRPDQPLRDRHSARLLSPPAWTDPDLRHLHGRGRRQAGASLWHCGGRGHERGHVLSACGRRAARGL